MTYGSLTRHSQQQRLKGGKMRALLGTSHCDKRYVVNEFIFRELAVGVAVCLCEVTYRMSELKTKRNVKKSQ